MESFNKTARVETSPNVRPQLSILIFNYSGRDLGRCLEHIFRQQQITDYEIVLIDDASCDGAWDIAVEFVQSYPDRITVQRNRMPHGPKENFRKALRMARGIYFTTLVADQVFRETYVRQCMDAIQADPSAGYRDVHRRDEYIERSYQNPWYVRACRRFPLVSILCYNYNYGRYLGQSLESVFAQTYENVELCLSDNASTDESWHIALKFARKHPDRVCLIRNRLNFGTDANFANCYWNMTGKYYINFCSDDVLSPHYVEKCVAILESHPEVGMVIVHRSILDEEGRRTEEPPFYNQSCIIPGKAQAAVYMMAGVNPSVSQIMYRLDAVRPRAVAGGLVTRYYGTRILDFKISLDYAVAYVKDPLLLHRVHAQSDTHEAETNLLPILGWYVLNHQLADLARIHQAEAAVKRLPESIYKLSSLAVRYAVRSLIEGDEATAHRYFHLAPAMCPEICQDETWIQLQSYFCADPSTKANLLQGFRTTPNLASRSVSYDPPPGSLPLESETPRHGILMNSATLKPEVPPRIAEPPSSL
ncbi:glycosyltransferase family 2 protein [Desulfosoma sp.]